MARFARFGRILDGVYLVAAWLAGGLLCLLCGLVIYSVVARYVGAYAGGASDVAGYVMATSSFMALAYGFRSGGHIRVVLAIQRLPLKGQRVMEVWCLAIMSAIAVFLAVYMARLVVDSLKWGTRSEGADAIALWIPQLPVAVGAGLFALAVLHTFVESIFVPAVAAERTRSAGEV